MKQYLGDRELSYNTFIQYIPSHCIHQDYISLMASGCRFKKMKDEIKPPEWISEILVNIMLKIFIPAII